MSFFSSVSFSICSLFLVISTSNSDFFFVLTRNGILLKIVLPCCFPMSLQLSRIISSQSLKSFFVGHFFRKSKFEFPRCVSPILPSYFSESRLFFFAIFHFLQLTSMPVLLFWQFRSFPLFFSENSSFLVSSSSFRNFSISASCCAEFPDKLAFNSEISFSFCSIVCS